MFNIDAQYAFNLQPEIQSLCRRTIERDIKLFREDELAQAISPTSGKCPAEHIDPRVITVSDFRIADGEVRDEYGRMIIVPTCVECPGGQKPHRSFYDDFLKQINILQHPHVCAACPLLHKCPVRFADGWNQVTIEETQGRLINRCRREQTAEFRDQYRVRSGIEATNSLLKRVTGLDRLRVRGRPAVFYNVISPSGRFQRLPGRLRR